jgi:hypothetical protein
MRDSVMGNLGLFTPTKSLIRSCGFVVEVHFSRATLMTADKPTQIQAHMCARTGPRTVSKTVSKDVRLESVGSRKCVGLVYTGVTGDRGFRKYLQINKSLVRFRPSPPTLTASAAES